MLLNDTGIDGTTGNPVISRVVGKIGVNGSVSSNFSFVIPATGTMSKGVFVGRFYPVSGAVNIAQAPTAAATGTATATVTPHGGTASTVMLTIDKIAAGTFGVYHMHGAMGTLYLDITWPVGGTKALYAVSDNANGAGNITEVGEAFLTL